MHPSVAEQGKTCRARREQDFNHFTTQYVAQLHLTVHISPLNCSVTGTCKPSKW